MSNVNDLLKNVQENIPLAPYTTFKIGGPARYFFIAKNIEEIKNAIKVAKDLKIPYFILGNGSNVLISDSGFGGLVIKIDDRELKIENNEIYAGAGVMLAALVKESTNAGLTGLEWLAGIPGTLGGAIYGNAGAFGYSIGEVAETVKVFDPGDLMEKTLSKSDCNFGYRHSIFKEKKYIILGADLKLKKGELEESAKLASEYLSKRKGKHPIGPSAGSIFKNPLIKENQKAYEKLIKQYPEIEKFKATGKIPAGWLIGQFGLCGKEIGGAMVSKEHGNFIVNIGGAKAEDVIILTSLIKQKIRVNFGIQLAEEIQYVGF